MEVENPVLAWCGRGLAAALILGSAMRASPVLAQAPAVSGGRAEVVDRLAELGQAVGLDADWDRGLAAYEGRMLAESGGVARQAEALRAALEQGGLPALGAAADELAALAAGIAEEFEREVRPALAAGADLAPARRLLAACLALAAEEPGWPLRVGHGPGAVGPGVDAAPGGAGGGGDV